jgi:tetratricopeptide (TPR) repeat protein
MRARSSILAATALTLLTAAPLAADTLSLKQQARTEYERMRYPKAQALARQATEENPDDAEAWFLLGWCTHYRCYDSRPLSGFSRATSDSTLDFLERAVQLDPKLGDAHYFIGAEYGCRCVDALCRGDARQARAELRAARAKNAYPDWALEYCRNLLKSCAQDAILFMDHDIIVNGVRYLQIVEGYRPDITAILTMGRARPTLPYKDGVRGAIRPAPIGWTREQILDMQSYRWGTDTVRIPVRPEVLKGLGIASSDTVLEWEVEQASPERAVLPAYTAQVIDIVETNRWQRPVYFLEPAQPGYIDSCLQNCGLVWRLLPVRAAEYGLSLDTTTMKRVLMDSASYRDLATYGQHPMPRASGILYGYFEALLTLAVHYNQAGDQTAYSAVIDRMAALGPVFFESVVPNYAERIALFRKGMPPAER